MEEATCFRELPGPATRIGGGALIRLSYLEVPASSLGFPQQRALTCSSEHAALCFCSDIDCPSSVGVRQTCV